MHGLSANTRLPETLGQFRILSLLGRGETSRVYRALDDRTGDEVALKVLTQLEHTGEPRLRLRREFRAIQRLEHPNVVKVFELYEQQPTHIAMEFLTGGNLYQALGYEPGRALPEEAIDQLLNVLDQVFNALSYVHLLEILHCDLKPQNVLIGEKGQVKLVDFGLAAAGADDSGATTTQRR